VPNTELEGARFEVFSRIVTDQAAGALRSGKDPQKVIDELAQKRRDFTPGGKFGVARPTGDYWQITMTDPRCKEYRDAVIDRSISASKMQHRASLYQATKAETIAELHIALRNFPEAARELARISQDRELGPFVKLEEKTMGGGTVRDYLDDVYGKAFTVTYNRGFVNGLPINLTAYRPGEDVLENGPDIIEPIMKYISDKLIPEFMKEVGFDELIDKLAEIHFLMCNARPYARGSAAITDWLIESLARSKGIELSAWKPGALADVKAMVTDQADYIRGYRAMFVDPPRKMSVK
jgi:hypothetical protein